MTTNRIKANVPLLVALIIMAAAGYLNGQPNAADTTRPQNAHSIERIERRHRTGPDGDRDGHEHSADRRHHNAETFRQFMKAELEHVPLLNGRMQRLMNIQAERYELQKRRQEVAAKPQQNRAATIESFHALLRRDLELSDESRKIAQEIVNELPEIRKELDARRNKLESDLAGASAADNDSETSASDARDLRRKMRYVEFLDNKLRDLEERPERLDVLTRMLRGVPFDDGQKDGRPDPLPRTPEDHLSDLRNKKRVLQKELKQVENEIDLLQKKKVNVGDSRSTATR